MAEVNMDGKHLPSSSHNLEQNQPPARSTSSRDIPSFLVHDVIDGSFCIVSHEELSEKHGNVLYCSSNLKKVQLMEKQLGGNVVIRMTNHCPERSSYTHTGSAKLQSSRYVVSGSNSEEENPFSDDATDDEYVPDISPLSSSSKSKNLLKKCKRRLFHDSAESPITSTEQQSSTSKSSINVITTTEDNISIPSCSVSPIERRAFVNTGHFNIDLQNNGVAMKTETVLHTGTYECDTVQEGNRIFGFLQAGVPFGPHKCLFMDNDSIDARKTAVCVLRVPKNETVKVIARFCIPAAYLTGEEMETAPDLYVSTIFVKRLTAPSKVKTLKGGPTKGKSHCCFYCRKMFVDISSHLLRIHSSESDVVEIFKLEANSRARNDALKALRTKGDHKYNELVMSTQRIPVRHHSKLELENAVTCPKCHSLFSKRNFARHERRCSGRPANYKRVTAEACEIENQRFGNISHKSRLFTEIVLDKLIGPIRKDDVFHEIVSDKCLRLAAERYAHMHQNSPAALKNDRQHLRRLARLLLEIKEIDPSVIDYEDFFKYYRYELMTEAVRALCGMNDKTQLVEKVSLATALKSSITFLLTGLIHKYNELRGTQPELDNLERFKALHLENYGVYIGRSAARVVLQRKAEKQNELPSPKDVKLFTQYMCREADEAFDELRKAYSYKAWLRLGKAELIKTIVFNRRRVSEVASMSLILYEQKTKVDENQRKSLNIMERALADRFWSMKLIGKRQHILHLLLDEDQCRHLDLFIVMRNTVGVPETNTYLFGVPTTGLYIDACNTIKEYSVNCGAEKPHLLRSTYLRKQVATLSQVLSMNDNQIGQIAKLMGHSQKVHEQVYRQDELLFQVTSWAKFLTIVSSEEDIHKYRGKSFEELLQVAETMEDVHDNPDTDDHLTATELYGPLELPQEELHEDAEILENPLIVQSNTGSSTSSLKAVSPSPGPSLTTDFLEQDNTEEPSSVSSVQSTRERKTEKTKQKTPKKKQFTHHSVRHNLTPKKRITSTPRKNSPKPTIAEILKTISTSPKKKRSKVAFRSEEVDILQRHFTVYFKNGQLAPPGECEKVLMENRIVFKDRCARDLYNWVQYQRNKCRRNIGKR